MCRYMSQQEQGLASTLNIPSSPLRSQQERLHSFKQRGIWAWAFHPGLLGKTSGNTDVMWDEPFHWAKRGCVLCITQPAPKSSAAPHHWPRQKTQIHPLQLQPPSALLGQWHSAGSRAGDSPQIWWFTPRLPWLRLQSQHSPRLGGSAQEQGHWHWNTAPASAFANEM